MYAYTHKYTYKHTYIIYYIYQLDILRTMFTKMNKIIFFKHILLKKLEPNYRINTFWFRFLFSIDLLLRKLIKSKPRSPLHSENHKLLLETKTEVFKG